MRELKKIPLHRSLTRQQLLAGCDRDLFLLLAMFCGLLLMSGITRMYWRNIFLGIGLWLAGLPVLAKLAVYDPHFSGKSWNTKEPTAIIIFNSHQSFRLYNRGGLRPLRFFGAPGMGDNLAVKVRYRLGSRNC
jgi:type IV secretory pathway TrbD component